MNSSLKFDDSIAEIEKLKNQIKKYETENQHLKSENFQLQHIIDNLPASIYWKNKEGAYIGFNKAGAESARKFNFPFDKKYILGKTDHDIFPTEMADIFRKNDLEVMEGKQEIIREEIATLPSGEKAIQLSTKKPLCNDKNEIIGVIGSTVEITYLKKVESELRNAKEKAEEANRLKTGFIHNMEHDIRTPFVGILGLSSTLWRQEENPKKKIYLEHIVSASKELLEYCNTVLDFSKIEFGQFPIINKRFNLVDSVKKIIYMENVAAIQKNIQFTSHIENVPPFVIGDEYRIIRILLNLLSNAIKFTEEGYVKLHITGYPRETEQKIIIKFIIEDSGIGIEKEKQRLVGEKFMRFSDSNKGHYKGLGLGISAVKQFIHDLEGELELESEIQKGSKFICMIPFTLPLLNDGITASIQDEG